MKVSSKNTCVALCTLKKGNANVKYCCYKTPSMTVATDQSSSHTLVPPGLGHTIECARYPLATAD